MPLLDYRSPTHAPEVDWAWRYVRFVPAVAAIYIPLTIAYVFISVELEEKGVRQDPFLYKVLERVLCFPAVPALAALQMDACTGFLLGIVINAALLGFSVIALWHLLYRLNQRIRSHRTR